MEKRNVKLLALGVLSLAGLLSGCGASTSGSGSSGAGDQTSTSIPKGITLHVLSYWQPEEMTVIKQLAAKWGKEHGDTVVVEQNSATGSDKFSNWAQEVRAGTGPDVAIAMPSDNLGTFYQEGLLAPATLMNPSDYPSQVAEGVKMGGNYYAYPVAAQSVALMYNKKEISTPPTTWNEFVKDANKYGFNMAQEQFYYDYVFLGGMGGYIFKDNNGTLDPNDIGLANSGAVAGFQLLQDMDQKYHWMNPSVDQSVATSQFDNGKVGMFISGPWDVAAAQKAGIQVGVAPIPTLPNGKPGTPLISNLTAIVSDKSKNMAAAQSLAQYLTNSAAELQYFKADADLPALSSLQTNSTITSDPIAKGFVDQLNTAVATPNIAQMQAVYSAQSVIPSILSGKLSAAEGAKQYVNNTKSAISVQQG
ncbi:maltose ABC transporter substrate-binding protein [Alicyclobacillus fastidiosus]|uniref:Maltodextrin-binding protein n=1 Tax=Alicyclobacillus fastidiosus TaxID=392011 RepID=A0ABY6ZGS9_9BACL|nr:maltose ABC transporter substrate-binding protein [Alicyclobacillus fastidiosus]WAH42054.1 maltose ABC transporter substrate-binding protein [Alicyclobacillus fastidiosus]GMA63817.1 maltose ABC transporter substrate-binding protein [Alicyclobacillus fastidiosus]